MLFIGGSIGKVLCLQGGSDRVFFLQMASPKQSRMRRGFSCWESQLETDVVRRYFLVAKIHDLLLESESGCQKLSRKSPTRRVETAPGTEIRLALNWPTKLLWTPFVAAGKFAEVGAQTSSEVEKRSRQTMGPIQKNCQLAAISLRNAKGELFWPLVQPLVFDACYLKH